MYKNKIPDEIQLSDPTWNDFFTQVVKRNRNAKHHQYLEDFLYCIGTKYQETRRSEKFIGDLLKLDVKSLLSSKSYRLYGYGQRIVLQKIWSRGGGGGGGGMWC